VNEVGATFQVDLRGVVDLLARHLYSGPNVYLRELLQNGVDAITARQALDPGSPATIRVKPWAGDGLEVVDTGIGLTTAEAHELLATVGRSSKRDLDLGVGREEFLGQFGIGLLSAFMVADEIELISRSAADPAAPTVLWTGHDDGRYDLTELPRRPGDEPGSIVHIRPRRGMEHWLATDSVAALAAEFGSLLPVDIAVQVGLGEGELAWRRVTEPNLPWLASYPHELARRDALAAFCERTLGFSPMAMIDLNVPLAGLTGVAFVLPTAVPPGSGGHHRVYLKRMLLGNRVAGLLPEWAFFVRCVVDATGLSPTASREQLYSDDVLLATQEALAATIRQWVLDLLDDESNLAKQFVRTHHLAVRSLALTDDAMLDLAAQVLPFESTDGPRTLAEIAAETDEIVYTSSLEEYRRVAAVARAQGVILVNAGYVYDGDLLEKLAHRPGWKVRPLRSEDIAQVLSPVDPARELEILDSLAAAAEIAEPLDVRPVVRRFEPDALPAILLGDRDGDYQRGAAETAAADADDPWSAVLAGLEQPDEGASRQLVLNDSNPTIRQWVKLNPSSPVFAAGLHSMYVSAVLLSGEPLRYREAELMNESLSVLLEAGLAGESKRDPDGPLPH
jgi:molecular chaperone HtpG